MANEYYATTGSPATSSQGASATMRSEFTSVAAGFDKLPALAGNGSKLVQINSGGTAMVAIALTVGALLFGGAAGVLGQDGANLFWDNTAKRLGIGNAAPTVALDVTGAGKFSTGLTVSAGGITATGNSTITGTLGGVTTFTASTSVVTPLVDATGALLLRSGGAGALQLSSATGVVSCNSDNTTTLGAATLRWLTVFTSVIDSGTVGSLALKTNGGTTVATFANSLLTTLAGSLTVTGGDVGTGVGGSLFLSTSGGQQFEATHTAGVTRHITVTGSNGGNPTLGVTGGSLAITPAVVMASSLVWGTGVANFGTITKRKTADESVTSSTALQDDDHLTFAIAANEEWVVDFDLDVGGNLALHGIKVAITAPSGATLNVAASIVGPGPSGTGSANATNGRTTTSGAAIDLNVIFFGSSATGLMRLSAWVLNGATPGNVTLQFAQSTSNGTAVKLFKGSHMQATRIV